MTYCSPLIAAKVRLAAALIEAGVSMTREELKFHGMECYVYPLPPFKPRPAPVVPFRSRLRSRRHPARPRRT